MSNSSRRIRVRIPAVTVEVVVNAWVGEYGCGNTDQSVRADVRSYFDLANHIPGHLTDVVRVVDAGS